MDIYMRLYILCRLANTVMVLMALLYEIKIKREKSAPAGI